MRSTRAFGGDSRSDGGTSQRVLGTVLTWMAEKTSAVFVVATANAVERLPGELVRKGRFDEIFLLDLPSAEERRAILDLQLRRRRPGHRLPWRCWWIAPPAFQGPSWSRP
jgi:SpoVK/Ycf46/Vps4 family AAA+-type ATPase